MQQVWRYPELAETIFQAYQSIEVRRSSYTLEDHPYIAIGASKDLYQAFRKEVLACLSIVNIRTSMIQKEFAMT